MKAYTTNFDPSTKRELYITLENGWTANRDFAEMHEHILRDGTYLDEFGGKSAESSVQYALRKAQSMALDICRDLIDLRVGNIFRAPPARNFDESPYSADIEAFVADVDGGGTSMDEFMRDALRK
ncbi:unnamed protein product, partial [marine sediment metagenome]